MKTNLQKANNAIDALVEDIKQVVRENGGIVDTQVKGCDRILAYITDYDSYLECLVMGIKLDGERLMILPDYGACYSFGLTDVRTVEGSEWYEVRRDSKDLLFTQAILSIAESLDQYI